MPQGWLASAVLDEIPDLACCQDPVDAEERKLGHRRTNLRIILRSTTETFRPNPFDSNGFANPKSLNGMQGVRSSSLLGSIPKAHSLTGFFSV